MNVITDFMDNQVVKVKPSFLVFDFSTNSFTLIDYSIINYIGNDLIVDFKGNLKSNYIVLDFITDILKLTTVNGWEVYLQKHYGKYELLFKKDLGEAVKISRGTIGNGITFEDQIKALPKLTNKLKYYSFKEQRFKTIFTNFGGRLDLLVNEQVYMPESKLALDLNTNYYWIVKKGLPVTCLFEWDPYTDKDLSTDEFLNLLVNDTKLVNYNYFTTSPSCKELFARITKQTYIKIDNSELWVHNNKAKLFTKFSNDVMSSKKEVVGDIKLTIKELMVDNIIKFINKKITELIVQLNTNEITLENLYKAYKTDTITVAVLHKDLRHFNLLNDYIKSNDILIGTRLSNYIELFKNDYKFYMLFTASYLLTQYSYLLYYEGN